MANINFSPLINGLNTYRQGLNSQYDAGQNREAIARNESHRQEAISRQDSKKWRAGIQKQDDEYQNGLKRKFGHLAKQFSSMTSGDDTQAKWDMTIGLHPNKDALGPEYLSVDTGPGLLMAEAGISGPSASNVAMPFASSPQGIFDRRTGNVAAPKQGQAQFKVVGGPSGQPMQQGPNGRLYAMPGGGKGNASADVKAEASKNIGSMIDRLGQVAQFKGPNKGPYTPHEVESSIGNWQGGDDSFIMGPLSRLGGWIETINSNYNPRDIRARIAGDSLALTAAVKKIARGSGEGVFTDADQKVLERQIGDLTKASGIGDYKQRLSDLKERINAAYGLSIRRNQDIQPGTSPDGTIIENSNGLKMVKRNGKWARYE